MSDPTATAAYQQGADGNPLPCARCGLPLPPWTTGKIVVAGGDDGDIYLHEGCVQP